MKTHLTFLSLNKMKKMNASNQNSSKKELNKKDTATKLQNFFKPAPKSFVIQEKSNVVIDSTKKFYVNVLKEKLKNYNADVTAESQAKNSLSQDDDVPPVTEECEGVRQQSKVNSNDAIISCGECEQKKIEGQKWEKEAREWESKYKNLKKTHVKMSLSYTDLQMKYNDLLQIATNQVHSESESDVADAVLSADEVFTKNEVKALMSIPLAKEKDSNFVLQCLKYAYKSNPTILTLKTVKGVPESIEIKDDGTEEHHPAKDPLTPKKLERIRELFIERIAKKCNIGSVEYGERIKQSNINKLIGWGIKNVAKKQK